MLFGSVYYCDYIFSSIVLCQHVNSRKVKTRVRTENAASQCIL